MPFTTTSTGGDGSGLPGPQGPAGEDAVLPQDLGTTDNPEFSTIILTSNGATNNITIGDDVILGDGNVANHVVIIGQQDATAGGIVLGTNETEFISTNGTNLSVTAGNDIVLLPGSNYAYLNMIDVDHRIATMADVTSGTQGDPGPQGDPGEPGADGADALWNFIGAYDGGTSYAIGDVVTYDGQLWYRTHANGGTVGNTPSEGFIWALLAAKGADGTDASGALVYLGNYVSGNGYIANIAVVRGSDNNLYIAKSSGGLGDPVGNTAEWDIFSDNATGADTGQITFVGVYIIGAGGGSGDGLGNGTIKLLPDEDLVQQQYHEDQYLIIDPTAPNHIHIRAGGVQDASTADLFLGAERNNVRVSDPSNSVTINTRPDPIISNHGNSNQASNTEFMVVSGTDILVGDTVSLYTGGDNYIVTAVTPEYPYAGLMTVVADGLSFITGETYTFTREQYPNTWTFEENGVLYTPTGGTEIVSSGSLDTTSVTGDINITAQGSGGPTRVNIAAQNSGKITLVAGGGIYAGSPDIASNEIATLADLPTGATGTFETSDSKLVTVTNGIITAIDPLT